MSRRKKWIGKAIKHEGSLTEWAKSHHFIKNEKIDLQKAYSYAKRKKLTHRMHQINLAKNLRRFKK